MGGQNLVGIGIDIATLSAEKQQVLEIFSELFVELSKYDGRKIAPISISGLGELNSALKATGDHIQALNQNINSLNNIVNANSSALSTNAASHTVLSNALRTTQNATTQNTTATQQATAAGNQNTNAMGAQGRAAANLTNEYRALKQAIKEKEAAYASAYMNFGKSSPEAKLALGDLGQSQKQLNSINKEIDTASSGAMKFGKTLTSGLSSLRTIAYILPGIGIAGIFNLAFEAISEMVSELDIFVDKTEETRAKWDALQKSLLQVLETEKQITSILRNDVSFSSDDADITLLNNKLGLYKAENKNRGELLAIEKELNAQRQISAAREFNQSGGFQTLDTLRGQLIGAESNYMNQTTANRNREAGMTGSTLEDAQKANAIEEQRLKTTLDLFKSQYQKQLDIVNNYSATMKEFKNSEAALETFNTAERVKLERETSLLLIDLNKNKNDFILKDERSSQNARLDAVRNNLEEQKKLISTNLKADLADPSISPNDRIILGQKAADDKIKADRQAKFDTFVINEAYRRRELAAELSIEKDISEAKQRENKAVIDNDKKSLEERLHALSIFVAEKKRMLDREYVNELEATRNSGKTQSEKDAMLQKRNSGVDEISSGTAKDITSIIKSFGADRIRELKESNKLLEKATADEYDYVKALTDLNTALDKGTIKYKDYAKAKESLQKGFKLQSLRTDIAVELEQIRAESAYALELFAEMNGAKYELEVANKSGNKNEINDAQAKYDALKDLHSQNSLAIAKDEKELAEKQAAYQLALHEVETSAERQLAANKEAIIHAFFDTATAIADGYYAHQEELIQRNIELVNKQYDNEIAAVNKSSLNAKDKVALDTQLKAQKDAADLQAEKKMRKMKHDNAVFDRDAAAVEVVWSTERAIMAALALPLPPPIPQQLAVSYGILGGLSLAKVMATNIPSYFAGTPDGGHVGGLARFGEIGPEQINEPGKLPYIQYTEVIKPLKKGTIVTPMYDVPEILEKRTSDDSWEQTRYLASKIEKANKDTKKAIHIHNHIDLGFEVYKSDILYGK